MYAPAAHVPCFGPSDLALTMLRVVFSTGRSAIRPMPISGARFFADEAGTEAAKEQAEAPKAAPKPTGDGSELLPPV